jgi:tetratricopeptide (TPR) repeat protein
MRETVVIAALCMAVCAIGFAAGPRPPSLSLTAVDREPAGGREALDDAAIAALEKAVADKPEDRRARFELISGLMASGKLAAARDAARAWREVDAYNLVVVRLLGDIYSELGKRREALRTYSAVVELLPEDPAAQRALAGVLKQSGDVEAAYERLTAAAALRPDDVGLRFELADAAQRIGKQAEAQAAFASVAASESANESIRYPAKQRLAQILSEQRREALTGGDTNDRARAARLDAEIEALQIKGGSINDIVVYLSWDTDRSDVDLWVTNPTGEKVYYEHKVDKFGGALFHDVTNGYGPESFTAKKAARGTYVVAVHYYSAGRSNFPEARGEVVVVLNEGTAKEKKHVLPYRLFQAKQVVTVAKISVQ